MINTVDTPAGPQTGRERIVRGGSFLSGEERGWNRNFRASFPPDQGSPFLGMRLARSIPGATIVMPSRNAWFLRLTDQYQTNKALLPEQRGII